MEFPKSLTRTCYRCKSTILWADTDARALVGGVMVQMHEGCKALWDKELEVMTDEEIQGTEASKDERASLNTTQSLSGTGA